MPTASGEEVPAVQLVELELDRAQVEPLLVPREQVPSLQSPGSRTPRRIRRRGTEASSTGGQELQAQAEGVRLRGGPPGFRQDRQGQRCQH